MSEPDIKFDFAASAEAVPLTADVQEKVDPLGSGFLWYTPPMASTKEHHTGGHEWCISGHDMQVLTTTVPSGEQVIIEIGSFLFGSADMKTAVECTCCGPMGCSQGCSRCMGGESCVKVLLTNEGGQEGYIGVTPNFPAKIIPVQFGKHVESGEYLISQGGAYMSHLGDVQVGCDGDFAPHTCCCAGFGCCRQKISGSDNSIAFLAAGGTLIYRALGHDERIIVDSRSVVAMESTVTLGVTCNGRFCTCCCGGEGCFSTTLTGPGRVYMQSMNLTKFANAVQVIEDRGSTTTSSNNTDVFNAA